MANKNLIDMRNAVLHEYIRQFQQQMKLTDMPWAWKDGLVGEAVIIDRQEFSIQYIFYVVDEGLWLSGMKFD